MAELKTRPTDATVARFLDGVPDAARRDDCRTLVAMMEQGVRCTSSCASTSSRWPGVDLDALEELVTQSEAGLLGRVGRTASRDDGHSYRSACIGSTREARSAGT